MAEKDMRWEKIFYSIYSDDSDYLDILAKSKSEKAKEYVKKYNHLRKSVRLDDYMRYENNRLQQEQFLRFMRGF